MLLLETLVSWIFYVFFVYISTSVISYYWYLEVNFMGLKFFSRYQSLNRTGL